MWNVKTKTSQKEHSSQWQKVKAALEDNSASISAGAAAATLGERFLRSKSNRTKSRRVWSRLFLSWGDIFFPPSPLSQEDFFFCLHEVRMQEFPFLHLGMWNIAGLSTFLLLALSHSRKFATWQHIFFSFPPKASLSVSLRKILASRCLCFSRLLLSIFFSRLSSNFGFLELDIEKGQQPKKRKKKFHNEVFSCVCLSLRASESYLVQVRVFLPCSSIKGLHILTPSKFQSGLISHHCTDRLICRGRRGRRWWWWWCKKQVLCYSVK